MHPISQFCNRKVVKMSSSERVKMPVHSLLELRAFWFFCCVYSSTQCDTILTLFSSCLNHSLFNR